MPSKKDSVAKAVQQAMPGWRVVKRRPASDAPRAARAGAKPDAISPGLAAQKAKAGVKAPAAAKKTTAKKSRHAQFITVAPVSQPDTIGKFQKVVLVKNGKVVAQQG